MVALPSAPVLVRALPEETCDVERHPDSELGSEVSSTNWLGSLLCSTGCHREPSELRLEHNLPRPPLAATAELPSRVRSARRRAWPRQCGGGQWLDEAELADGGLPSSPEGGEERAMSEVHLQIALPSSPSSSLLPVAAAEGGRSARQNRSWRKVEEDEEDDEEACDHDDPDERVAGAEELPLPRASSKARGGSLREGDTRTLCADATGLWCSSCTGSTEAPASPQAISLGSGVGTRSSSIDPLQAVAARTAGTSEERYAAVLPPHGADATAPSGSQSAEAAQFEDEASSSHQTWTHRAIALSVGAVSAGAFATAAGGALPVAIAAGSMGFTLGLLSSILGIRVGRWVS